MEGHLRSTEENKQPSRCELAKGESRRQRPRVVGVGVSVVGVGVAGANGAGHAPAMGFGPINPVMESMETGEEQMNTSLPQL